MRKAFYYDRAVPPKRWLIVASLLWDKIWISPIIVNLLSAPDSFTDFKDAFLTKIFQNLDVLDFSDPIRDEDKFLALLENPEDSDHLKEVVKEYIEIQKPNEGPVVEAMKLSEKANFYIKTGNKRLALQFAKEAKKIMDNRFKASKIIDEITYCNHAFFNSKFKEVYSDLDYFFEKEKTFENYWPNSNKIFMHSVTALLPTEPEQISLSQIRDFRGKSVAARFKFKMEAEKILLEILHATSDKDLEPSLRLFSDILNSELDSLKKRYTECKIAAMLKAIPIVTVVPTLLALLFQAVDIPIYNAGTIITGLSLGGTSIVSSIESFRSEIRKSPWGFLMSLEKI